MPPKVKNFIIALSLAHLFVIAEWFNLLFSPERDYFAHTLSRSGFFAIVLVIATSTVGFYFLLQMEQRSRSPRANFWVYIFLSVFLVLVLNNLRTTTGFSVAHPTLSFGHFLGDWGQPGNKIKLALVVAVLGVIYRRWSHWWVFILRNGLVLFLFLPFATLGKVSYRVLKFKQPAPLSLVRPGEVGAAKPQVLWMVFDEMDGYFSFDGRPNGVDLPAFDRLKSESVSASNAFPPSSATLISMPSYITGDLIAGSIPLSRDELQYTVCEDGEKKLFSQQRNIFSRARELGIPSAVVGWYLPYCRNLKGSLDFCEWVSAFQYQYQQDIFQNVRDVLARTVGIKDSPSEIHTDVYHAILESAERLVVSPHLGLTLLHWPVPHHPGLNHEPGKKFADPGHEVAAEYFDNLMVADTALAHIREKMELAGNWESTTIIVTSDHFWRFAPDAFRAQQGELVRHFQVPLIVKLAGHRVPVRFDGEINTVILHDLILGVMKREIGTPLQLVTFFERRKTDRVARFFRTLASTPSSRWKCGQPAAWDSQAFPNFESH